jgi:hypothetical protein
MTYTPTADDLFEQQLKNLREAARSIERRDRPDAHDIAESCRWAASRLTDYRAQDAAKAK